MTKTVINLHQTRTRRLSLEKGQKELKRSTNREFAEVEFILGSGKHDFPQRNGASIDVQGIRRGLGQHSWLEGVHRQHSVVCVRPTTDDQGEDEEGKRANKHNHNYGGNRA